MKISAIFVAGLASALATKKVYSINGLVTDNGQIDQPWSIDFYVAPNSTARPITHCAASVPWSPQKPTNNTISGKTYSCDGTDYKFVYTIGKGTQKAVLQLYQTFASSKEIKGAVAFPNPKCEPTPAWYVCKGAANYTITLQ